MVQINLLPPSAKKKGRPRLDLNINLGPIIFVLGVLLAVIIVAWTVLNIQLSTKQKELSRLKEHLKSSNVSLQKLDKLRKDKQGFLGKLEFLERSLKREALWAENLNRLSNLVPPGIWLKNLVLHSGKENELHKYLELDINGSAVSLEGEELINLIGRFMSALKEDEVLSQQLSEIKLVSSQRGKSGKVEIMNFKFFCQFK